MKRLTRRQAEILEFIREFSAVYGYSPTVREIGERFGIRSTNAVADHLTALERKGVIEREDRAARGISLREERTGSRRIPLVGQIAAGSPLLAEENIEDWLALDEGFAPAGKLFALRVRGDSMIGAHILDGDIVIVRMQEEAERGQIVAALIDDEATLKTYLPQGGSVILLPANPAYDPLIFDRDNGGSLSILGIAVGLMRRSIGLVPLP
jgi:repressor LexA